MTIKRVIALVAVASFAVGGLTACSKDKYKDKNSKNKKELSKEQQKTKTLNQHLADAEKQLADYKVRDAEFKVAQDELTEAQVAHAQLGDDLYKKGSELNQREDLLRSQELALQASQANLIKAEGDLDLLQESLDNAVAASQKEMADAKKLQGKELMRSAKTDKREQRIKELQAEITAARKQLSEDSQAQLEDIAKVQKKFEQEIKAAAEAELKKIEEVHKGNQKELKERTENLRKKTEADLQRIAQARAEARGLFATTRGGQEIFDSVAADKAIPVYIAYRLSKVDREEGIRLRSRIILSNDKPAYSDLNNFWPITIKTLKTNDEPLKPVNLTDRYVVLAKAGKVIEIREYLKSLMRRDMDAVIVEPITQTQISVRMNVYDAEYEKVDSVKLGGLTVQDDFSAKNLKNIAAYAFTVDKKACSDRYLTPRCLSAAGKSGLLDENVKVRSTFYGRVFVSPRTLLLKHLEETKENLAKISTDSVRLSVDVEIKKSNDPLVDVGAGHRKRVALGKGIWELYQQSRAVEDEEIGHIVRFIEFEFEMTAYQELNGSYIPVAPDIEGKKVTDLVDQTHSGNRFIFPIGNSQRLDSINDVALIGLMGSPPAIFVDYYKNMIDGLLGAIKK